MKNKWSIIALLVVIPIAGCASSKPGVSYNVTELNYPAELGVIKRADWGWRELEAGIPEHKISKITIHHGGEEFADDKDVIEYLRTLQTWSQTERDWLDIPYHFMIDLQGNIYETRPINFPGDTNTEYDPTGHALISVMGNYENRKLSDDQLSSLIALTAFLAGQYGVGADDIKGHKDYAATLCPGKDIYRYLEDGTIIKGVFAQSGN